MVADNNRRAIAAIIGTLVGIVGLACYILYKSCLRCATVQMIYRLEFIRPGASTETRTTRSYGRDRSAATENV